MNFLPGQVLTVDKTLCFQSAGGTVLIDLNNSVHYAAMKPYEGHTVVLGIRAEHLTDSVTSQHRPYYSPDKYTIFEAVEHMGSETLAYFSLEDHRFIARLSGDTLVDMDKGMALFWDIDKAHFFDTETEQAIR